MKALIVAALASFAIHALAAPVSGARKCNRCIQWCNANEATDAAAEACLGRCLRQAFCQQNGKSLFSFEDASEFLTETAEEVAD